MRSISLDRMHLAWSSVFFFVRITVFSIRRTSIWMSIPRLSTLLTVLSTLRSPESEHTMSCAWNLASALKLLRIFTHSHFSSDYKQRWCYKRNVISMAHFPMSFYLFTSFSFVFLHCADLLITKPLHEEVFSSLNFFSIKRIRFIGEK